MKKFKFLVFGVFLISISIGGCKKEDTKVEQEIVPEKFSVDIPASISSVTTKSTNKDAILQGSDIYGPLRGFIFLGESAANLTEDIMHMIRAYHLNRPMTFSFVSDDDHRQKTVVIIEKSEYENTIWDYQMTIYDIDNINTMGIENIALQVFWNKYPTKGISILRPYNIDRLKNTNQQNAMFRIDYSEAGENGYDEQMLVTISGITLADESVDKFSINAIKLFAGRKGDKVEVFGNSNHPNGSLFNQVKGLQYAFVAASDRSKDIGVAEVALPASSVNSIDRIVILKDNSIKNVFTNQLTQLYPNITPEILNNYLQNTEAPGYFNNGGFISAGVLPNADYSPLVTLINNLTPYNPSVVANQTVTFNSVILK